MKYEQAKTFDEMMEVAQKKKHGGSHATDCVIHGESSSLSTKLEPWKHPEMNFCMESTMEQIINQMN